MATFLVAHGAWSAGWAWKKMRPLLRARGHEFFTPTYTGMGERAHLAHKDIDLETHIADVLGVLQYEDLRNVILVGHSYGGMVATGVADRATRAHRAARLPRRLRAARRPVAARPADRRSAPARARRREARRATAGASRPTPRRPTPARGPRLGQRPPRAAADQELRAEDQADRRRRQAAAHLHLLQDLAAPATSSASSAIAPSSEKGWKCIDIDASHSPNVTAPEALAKILDGIASARG